MLERLWVVMKIRVNGVDMRIKATTLAVYSCFMPANTTLSVPQAGLAR